MRILHGSDFHGLEKAFSDFSGMLKNGPYDLGVLSGDLTSYVEDKVEEEKKLIRILRQSNKTILFIMGNDDGILDNDWSTSGNVVNINLKKLKVKDCCLIGYSYTNPFVGGQFEKSEREQAKDFQSLQKSFEAKTILITHGPAFGVKDSATVGNHFGSKALKELLADDRIMLHLCGHIHQASGFDQKTVNASYPETREFADIDVENKIVKFVKNQEQPADLKKMDYTDLT